MSVDGGRQGSSGSPARQAKSSLFGRFPFLEAPHEMDQIAFACRSREKSGSVPLGIIGIEIDQKDRGNDLGFFAIPFGILVVARSNDATGDIPPSRR